MVHLVQKNLVVEAFAPQFLLVAYLCIADKFELLALQDERLRVGACSTSRQQETWVSMLFHANCSVQSVDVLRIDNGAY